MKYFQQKSESANVSRWCWSHLEFCVQFWAHTLKEFRPEESREGPQGERGESAVQILEKGAREKLYYR